MGVVPISTPSDILYCVVLGCSSKLMYSAGKFSGMSVQQMYRNYGWVPSESWEEDHWDGKIFCAKHEDYALELVYDEDH